jgi:hypothetical protein
MDLTYDELRQVARALGLKTTRNGRSKTKKILAGEIERAKAGFDPELAQEYRVSDLVIFAKNAGISRYQNGKAKTKQELIADLRSSRPTATGKRRDALRATLCGGAAATAGDARLVQELENTKAQLAQVEGELQRVYEQYQKVSLSNKRMNRRMDVLSMKSTNLIDEP